MKILLAVDDSDAAAKVIRRLAKLAREFARPPAVHLLYVVSRLSEAAEKEFGKKGPGHYYAQQARVPLDQARAVLERYLAITGDPDRLQEIVEHLLRHAVEGTPEGGRILLHTDGHATAARVIATVGRSPRGVTKEPTLERARPP